MNLAKRKHHVRRQKSALAGRRYCIRRLPDEPGRLRGVFAHAANESGNLRTGIAGFAEITCGGLPRKCKELAFVGTFGETSQRIEVQVVA